MVSRRSPIKQITSLSPYHVQFLCIDRSRGDVRFIFVRFLIPGRNAQKVSFTFPAPRTGLEAPPGPDPAIEAPISAEELEDIEGLFASTDDELMAASECNFRSSSGPPCEMCGKTPEVTKAVTVTDCNVVVSVVPYGIRCTYSQMQFQRQSMC